MLRGSYSGISRTNIEQHATPSVLCTCTAEHAFPTTWLLDHGPRTAEQRRGRWGDMLDRAGCTLRERINAKPCFNRLAVLGHSTKGGKCGCVFVDVWSGSGG